MTHEQNSSADTTQNARPSPLPFDPADLVAIRVLPAQFARMMEVSRQTVSRWIHEGKVTLGPDGKLDPAKATREVIERTDPARLRARVLKQATATHDELRDRIRELEEERTRHDEIVEAHVRAARFREQNETAGRLKEFMDAIEARFPEAQEAHAAGRLDQWLDDVCGFVFYGLEPGDDPDASDGDHEPDEDE